jgi:uracil-DNA glycosylase
MKLKDLIESKKWQEVLTPFFTTPEWHCIDERFNAARNRGETIYPQEEDIFRTLNLLDPEDVKVVILGQDPYHGPDQADGLAFSVSKTKKLPPSLKNIFKAIKETTGKESQCTSGNLFPWVEQGVLLLNSSLSVEAGKANSHQSFGWERLTDFIIEFLGGEGKPKVFLLWGGFAGKKKSLIHADTHRVISTVHPSPLSAYRGFFEHPQFLETNHFLEKHGFSPIVW